MDLSATDAVDAWTITKGSDGIVIADVDSGILFNHPDLLRAGPISLGAGFGGRLLPGYDFVGQDFNPNSPYNGLGTYLIANDGDGWDPDPSDPGDWISSWTSAIRMISSLAIRRNRVPGTVRVWSVFSARSPTIPPVSRA